MLKGLVRNCKCPCDMEASSKCAKPLCEMRNEKRLKVAGIEGDRSVCARMAALGIYPGAEMELLCAGCGAPCLVRVRGGTLSLGQDVSDKILVTAMS